MTKEEAARVLMTGQGDVKAAQDAYYGGSGGGGYYGQESSVQQAAASPSGPPQVNLDFTPQFEEHSGYNPNQFATADTAANLAKLTGGTVSQTEPVGPLQPPPQQLVNYGTPENFNAGLLARQMSRPEDSPWMKEAIMRAQLGYSAGTGAATPTYRSPYPQQVQQMASQFPTGVRQSPTMPSTASRMTAPPTAATQSTMMRRYPAIRQRPPFRFPMAFRRPTGGGTPTGGTQNPMGG